MMVFRKEFLLLASLLLITLFDVTSGCSPKLRYKHHHSSESSYHPSSYSSYHPSSHSSGGYDSQRNRSNHSDNTEDNDYRYKREVSKNSESTNSLRTSCAQTLCASSPNYPIFDINKAVTVLDRVLTSKSHKRYSQMRKRVDPIVIKYFYTLQHVIFNHDLPEPGGCDHYLDIFSPQEGYSSHDQHAYYIVNLPKYHQHVQAIYCTYPGDVCENNFTSSTCQQVYREEKLMVLPVDSEFDISSFRVKKFKVPNGCACSKPTSL